MNSEDAAIRRRLFLAREAAKFTQAEVAKEMKASRQTVSRWESGESSPTLEQLRDLCMMYGVMPCYVLLGSSELPVVASRALRPPSRQTSVDPQ